jgi:hypothetical protein
VTRLPFVALALGLALAGSAGCGPTAKQSDPDTARATLRRTLDAWKAGETQDALAKASSPVTAVDHQWKKGIKLLDYQVADGNTASGYDIRFSATLTVEDEQGKKKQQKATYNVSTAPGLVVVRKDDP